MTLSFRAALLLLLPLSFSCKRTEDQSALASALSVDAPQIRQVMKDPEAYEVQILFSQIERKGDSVIFKDDSFQVQSNQYFYPASSVKFPIALLALEKIANNDSINSTSRFFVEGDSVETTLRAEVSKIFAVSDNEAYNRLFEFLGKDYINNQLEQKYIGPARIAHRLSTDNADELRTRPLIFYLNDSTVAEWPGTTSSPVTPLEIEKVMKGKGYYDGDSLIMEPMDFSRKNYLPVQSLHNLMKRVIFPENFPEEEAFALTPEDRDFVLNAMHAPPYTQGYDREEYYDSYVKFFMFGDRKDPIPEHIKIYNKVGYAYGYLTDCSYIRDEKNEVEFILTATIHVNEDGIYNDNKYEYDEVGIPFLSELGRQLYDRIAAQQL
ncbi:serine hydrolase [Robertkochia flava]|uniref:serine hydrolase n=1 Tax=Robertkochia flava TaxID=3447986 RepID=UPI001CC912A0|nr:serine hydrolase [Robertkochia marina]